MDKLQVQNTESGGSNNTGTENLRPGGRAESDSLVGGIIDGKYQIIELIGTGGMGRVYKAKQILMNQVVAIKILPKELTKQPLSMKRFSHESKAASNIDHTNVVAVRDFGLCKEHEVAYLVMPYVQGHSLRTYLKQERKLGIERSLKIFIQICAGLSKAHKQGVVHRDIKPSNIILTEADGEKEIVKIIDFGIAKVRSIDGSTMLETLTATSETIGSPHYMSPEQCKHDEVDQRSDIYSMGCLMYETLHGDTPFNAEKYSAILMQHITAQPPHLVAEDEDPILVQRLDAVIQKCLAKEPSMRYQTVDDLKTDLDKVQSRINQLKSGETNRVLLALNDFVYGIPRIFFKVIKAFFKQRLVIAIFGLILFICGIDYLLSCIEPPKADRQLTMRACIFPRTQIDSVLNHYWDSIKVIDPTVEKDNSVAEEFLDTLLGKAELGRLSGNFNQAIDKYNDALAVSRKYNLNMENSSLGGELNAHLAYCFLLGSDNQQSAHQAAARALEIYTRCGLQNGPQSLLAYAVLGELARVEGDRRSADSYFDKFVHLSFEHSIDKLSPLELAVGNTYAGNFYGEISKYKLADALYRRAVLYWQEMGEPAQFNLGVTLNNRAVIELKENDLNTAQKDLDNAKRSLIEARADNHDIAIVLFNLSDVFSAKHDLLSWFTVRKEALEHWVLR